MIADNPTINVHLNGPANKIIIEPDMQSKLPPTLHL